MSKESTRLLKRIAIALENISEDLTVKEILTVQKEGGREVSRDLEFYNLKRIDIALECIREDIKDLRDLAKENNKPNVEVKSKDIDFERLFNQDTDYGNLKTDRPNICQPTIRK